jgi:ATP-dependent DNA helicase RecG
MQMYLEDIVEADKYESFKMEAKARLNRDDIVGWLKTIPGFANTKGGTMYIGVEDKTNKLIGFDRKEADNERIFFTNQINEHLYPYPPMDIDFIPYENNGRELCIIRVVVHESPVKPVILKYRGLYGIFMRRGGYTNEADYEEMTNMFVANRDTQYDSTDTGVEYSRSDFTKLLSCYSEHNDGKELPDKELKAVHFFNNRNMLKTGALLFMDAYDGERTAVQCSVFSGLTKGTDRIATAKKFQGNILDTIEFALTFIDQRMNHTFIKKDRGRENLDAYPQRAVFEGIVNAVAHRNYFLLGTQIQIDMFRDRLEIASPGSFYQGEPIEKTYNLSQYLSTRRNPLITDILVMCNMMEARGTGFDRIIESYADVDIRHKPFIYSSSSHFTLVLPDMTYDDGVDTGIMPIIDFISLERVSDYDRKILSYCHYGVQQPHEIASYIGISDSSYFRKKILGGLVEKGYLLEERDKNRRKYRTNPDIVL